MAASEPSLTDLAAPDPVLAAPPAGAWARMRKALKNGAALLLVALGLLGIILPLIPGWPLAAIGLGMLSADYAWARKLLARFRRADKKAAKA